MKIIKNFSAFLLISAVVMIFPFTAKAADLNTAVKTGDRGIIGIIVAVAAFIATAFITTKLTKYKNKKPK